MPEQLSRATAATCALLAAVGFGGAYAFAHDGPATTSTAAALPTTIRLKDDPIGGVRRVGSLPALIVPPPRPTPPAPAPVVENPRPVVPASAPAPAPTPAPRPRTPAQKPTTFDDSG